MGVIGEGGSVEILWLFSVFEIMLEIDENSKNKTEKYPGTRSTTRVPGYPGNAGTGTRVTERVPGKITST